MSHPDDADIMQLDLFDTSGMVAVVPKPTKKRARPGYWTNERKTQCQRLLQPWWAKHGNGWAQNYGAVYGVIMCALYNGMTEEELAASLEILGDERRPISGGTLMVAARRAETNRVASAEVERDFARRDPEFYRGMTL